MCIFELKLERKVTNLNVGERSIYSNEEDTGTVYPL